MAGAILELGLAVSTSKSCANRLVVLDFNIRGGVRGNMWHHLRAFVEMNLSHKGLLWWSHTHISIWTIMALGRVKCFREISKGGLMICNEAL